jgi:hypothetical protein
MKRKEHKPSFDEDCSDFLIRGCMLKFSGYSIRKKIDADNLKNVRREARKHFRSRKLKLMN